MESVRNGLETVVPQARIFAQRFTLGPAKPGKIQARFSGPDPRTLRELAQQATDLYFADGELTNIHIDWRSKVKVMEPILSEAPARANGITRPDLARECMLDRVESRDYHMQRACSTPPVRGKG